MSTTIKDLRAEIESNIDRLPLPTFPYVPKAEPSPWLYEFYPAEPTTDTPKEPAK